MAKYCTHIPLVINAKDLHCQFSLLVYRLGNGT